MTDFKAFLCIKCNRRFIRSKEIYKPLYNPMEKTICFHEIFALSFMPRCETDYLSDFALRGKDFIKETTLTKLDRLLYL